MANQYVNKVAVNGKTVLDLSGDTVYPGMLAKGITAHDKSGAKITGTLTVPGQETRNVELNMKSGNQAIVSSTGMLMKQVTVVKPGTFLPENIKKGVNIGGVIGTLEASPSGGGSSSETWVLNNEVYPPDSVGETFNVNFTSNGLSFSSIGVSVNLRRQILYDSTVVKAFDAWTSQAYRKLTFDAPPTGDLLTWLQANGVKQANDTAVQPEKTLTITSNGTTTITPDAPYDALKKVSVQTNIDPYDPEMAETVTCLSAACTIYGVFSMSGNDGNKVVAPYGYTGSQAGGAKILKGSHITFQSTMGGFPIYWTPSDALSVVSNAIYYPSGTKDTGVYVCKVIKDFQLLMDD